MLKEKESSLSRILGAAPNEAPTAGHPGEAEIDAAIKVLRSLIEAAENGNQRGEDLLIRAAQAIGWRA